MSRPIIVPELGATDIILSAWYVRPGETVYAGDRLVELLLGSATFELVAPCAGTFVEQCAWPEDRLTPGQVVGQLLSEPEA